MSIVSKVFPEFKFDWLADATKKTLPIELNFKIEAENCENVSKLLKHFKFLKVQTNFIDNYNFATLI